MSHSLLLVSLILCSTIDSLPSHNRTTSKWIMASICPKLPNRRGTSRGRLYYTERLRVSYLLGPRVSCVRDLHFRRCHQLKVVVNHLYYFVQRLQTFILDKKNKCAVVKILWTSQIQLSQRQRRRQNYCCHCYCSPFLSALQGFTSIYLLVSTCVEISSVHVMNRPIARGNISS